MNDEELFRVLESQTTAGQWRRVERAFWVAAQAIAEPLLRLGPVRRASDAVADVIVWLGTLGRPR